MASRLAFLFSLALIAGCAASAMSPAPGTVNGCANGDFAYSPKCLSIAAGQSVTFFGDPTQGSDFTAHPLRPGGADGTDPGASGNPIAAQVRGSTYTVVFPMAGTYGYFCQEHQSMGMYGAVQVK